MITNKIIGNIHNIFILGRGMKNEIIRKQIITKEKNFIISITKELQLTIHIEPE